MDGGADLVGIVGDPPAGLDAALADADVDSRSGAVESVLAAGPDLVVAAGETACLDAARAAPEAPVLAVDAGRGFRSVGRAVAPDVVGRVVEEGAATESIPVLSVEHDGETVGRAVADVTLLSAEVAHISEYSAATGDVSVSRFRADGVVVATPAGSAGYARRVGGPVIAPETGVGAIVPVAPFATDPDHWVVSLADVRLSVERDETPVALFADDREVATVVRGESVRIATDGTADVVAVPESLPQFA